MIPILSMPRAGRRMAIARRAALCGALLLSPGLVRAQTPPSACPPVAQMPTTTELQAGLDAARDRGFLWRISRDGRASWLYGTVHIGKLAWAFPGPQVRAALVGADALALEIDLTDPAMTAQLSTQLRAPTTPVALPAELVQRIQQQVAAACLPEQALAGLHPVMQAMTLTVLAARWDGLDPSYAQELTLAGFARASNKTVVSLESVESQVSLLIPAQAEQAVTLADQSLQQLEKGGARRVLARLAQVWERGLFDELGRYEAWCECALNDDERAFMRRLNDERNPALADAIAAQHVQRRSVFAAVGALHMTGPQALPLLLAQRGFAVERIVFAPM